MLIHVGLAANNRDRVNFPTELIWYFLHNIIAEKIYSPTMTTVNTSGCFFYKLTSEGFYATVKCNLMLIYHTPTRQLIIVWNKLPGWSALEEACEGTNVIGTSLFHCIFYLLLLLLYKCMRSYLKYVNNIQNHDNYD